MLAGQTFDAQEFLAAVRGDITVGDGRIIGFAGSASSPGMRVSGSETVAFPFTRIELAAPGSIPFSTRGI